jgi:hypothetical protein
MEGRGAMAVAMEEAAMVAIFDGIIWVAAAVAIVSFSLAALGGLVWGALRLYMIAARAYLRRRQL